MSITFQYTRTKRLAVQMRELTLGQSITLCKLPDDKYEHQITEFLRAVAAEATTPTAEHVADPRLWTVQERVMLVTKYLAQVLTDGPDFSIGKGTVSQFLALDQDLPAKSVDVGEVAGKRCIVRPLLGAHVEAMEGMCTTSGEWLRAAMACQLFPAEQDATHQTDWAGQSEHDIQKWISDRITRIEALPASDAVEMFEAWQIGCDQLAHFMSISFDDKGITVLPRARDDDGKEVGADVGPARFLPAAGIGHAERRLAE